uniref:Serum albumin n=1 Tax=Anthurium amnicola TaxID=1678845 RepID=A0A1D1ZLT8_9ARAE
MDPMDVKARVMTKDEFLWEYSRKHPEATLAQAQDAYKKYEEEQAKDTQNDKTTAVVLHQQKQAFVEAFKIPYQDPLKIVERFQDYINKKHAYWFANKKNHLPYGTLFQSSGYGKTRLIEQIAMKIPTLYVCLRPKRSTGYPPATPYAPEIFDSLGQISSGEEWRFMFILWHAIKKLHGYSLNESAENLWKWQLDYEWCNKFWKEVSEASKDWKKVDQKDANLGMDRFPFTENPDNQIKILLCIDEARSLIDSVQDDGCTQFRLFRRAMRHIGWNGFFVLFLDTLSKISNFTPPSSADPSARKDDLGFELFHPFIRLTTMDIFEGKAEDLAGTSEEGQIVQLARLGRPLIYSYFDVKRKSSSTEVALRGLVSLLQIKLFGGVNAFKDSKKKMSSIAILSVLVCLDISPQSKIASDLVASHMATCVAVSRDRERLLVRYPSEPLLAEAALSAITNNDTLVCVLQKFNEMLKKGFVDAGPRGEVVARIILVLAVRSIQEKKEWKSTVITVKRLMELLDPAAVDNLQHFVDATVAFTHFIPITYVPKTRSLKEYYRRRCAVILKRNNPGADIMIPVKLAEDRYSYILVQVKNYASSDRNADKSYPESGSSKLTSRFVFRKSDLKDHGEQYITLYWQLGFQGQLREVPPIRKVKRQKLEEQQQHPFAHFGLNFFKFLDPTVKEELADLLGAFISPFDEAWKFENEETGDYWSEEQIVAQDPLVYESSISSLT